MRPYPKLFEKLQISKKTHIVFDDYHLVTNNTIHQAVAHLLKYLPENIYVFIISRHILPPPLHRFKVQFETLEVTAEELKFSNEEAQQFFKEVVPMEITREQVHELTHITGGWVAGFQIFGLFQKSARNSGQPIEMINFSGKQAMDYLINEVVNEQPERIKKFLYQTTVLNRLNADLCMHVTGFSDTQKILDDLNRHHLFLTPLDSKHRWHRYHQLFAEAVREWVEIFLPGLQTQCRKKAAMWCAQNQYPTESFQYALVSGDYELLSDLLEDYLTLNISRFEVDSVLGWLAKLPKDILLKRPILRLIECTYKVLVKGQIVEAEAILPEIEEQIKGVRKFDDPDGMDFANYLPYLKMMLDSHKKMFQVDLGKANAEIKKMSSKNKLITAYMKVNIVTRMHLAQCDVLSAEKVLNSTKAEMFQSKYFSDRIIWIAMMSSVKRMLGQLRQSDRILSEGYDFLDRENLSDTPLKYVLFFSTAVNCYLRNDLEKAIAYFRPSVQYMEKIGLVHAVLEAYYFLSIVWMSKGDLNKAMYIARKSKVLSDSLDYPSIGDFTDTMHFLLSVRQGNTEVIKKRTALGKPDVSDPISHKFMDEFNILVISMALQGKLEEAIQKLEAVRKRYVKRKILGSVLNIDIMRAGILFTMGKKDVAMAIIEQTITFSEKEGYVRPFKRACRPIKSCGCYFSNFKRACRPIKAHQPFRFSCGKQNPARGL